MWAALRLAHQQLPANQLEAVAGLEDAEIHHLLVLEPAPAFRSHGIDRHRLRQQVRDGDASGGKREG